MDTIKITEFANFFKATANGETRYYATRKEAMNFDPGAVFVRGYGVYDTTVAGSYAVEVYPTKKQAEAHEPASAMKAPTSAVDDDDDFGVALGEAPHLADEDDEKPSKTARKTATKKRGR
jgi:hypothetical protein